METDSVTRLRIISSKPEDLIKIIHTAHNELILNN
jgi:hypothetical protein